jgi:hypothetical protein
MVPLEYRSTIHRQPIFQRANNCSDLAQILCIDCEKWNRGEGTRAVPSRLLAWAEDSCFAFGEPAVRGFKFSG